MSDTEIWLTHYQFGGRVMTRFVRPLCLLALACFLFGMLLILCSMPAALAQQKEHGIRVACNEASHRVDVFVDGQLFTSYVWPETLKTPVLYPLRTAKGTVVTRGFPLEPRP